MKRMEEMTLHPAQRERGRGRGRGRTDFTLILAAPLILWGAAAAGQALAADQATVKETSVVVDAAPQGAGDAAAPAKKEGGGSPLALSVEFHAVLQSLVYFRNDSDFDRTEPAYAAEGQTMGLAGTVFNPKVALDAGKFIRIFYEAELGINLWSRNNPDEERNVADDIFVLKHREIWGKAYLGSPNLALKAGFHRFTDPTGLFFDHWIGVASLLVETPRASYGISFGQVPDTVYEGVDLTENNFKHDTYVAALRGDFLAGTHGRVNAGVYALIDTSTVRKPNVVVMPCVDVAWRFGDFRLAVDAALQAGTEMNATVDGDDAVNISWALQAHGAWEKKGYRLGFNVLFLGPDDDHEASPTQGAFFYSGKNKSPTLLFTEDELRDTYANFDEGMAARRGAFHLVRSGLALFDVSFSKLLAGGFVEPGVTLAALVALNGDNALGRSWGGFEADLHLDLRFSQNTALRVAGAVLAPGEALSVNVNAIDLHATDPVYMLEAVFDVRI